MLLLGPRYSEMCWQVICSWARSIFIKPPNSHGTCGCSSSRRNLARTSPESKENNTRLWPPMAFSLGSSCLHLLGPGQKALHGPTTLEIEISECMLKGAPHMDIPLPRGKTRCLRIMHRRGCTEKFTEDSCELAINAAAHRHTGAH